MCHREDMEETTMTTTVLSEDMKRVVNEQRLGYIATVCPDGSPNLSPKGTTAVWDDEHLIFADICSPGTISNLQSHPVVEINVVDPIVRKGYRFKGTATILREGPQYDEAVRFYQDRGVESLIQHIVLVNVERALPVISPVYDAGQTEEEIRRRCIHSWQVLYQDDANGRTEE